MRILLYATRGRYGQASYPLLLGRIARSQRHGSRCLRRMHHDARVEDIRNVGIIAHVDAVSFTLPDFWL